MLEGSNLINQWDAVCHHITYVCVMKGFRYQCEMESNQPNDMAQFTKSTCVDCSFPAS